MKEIQFPLFAVTAPDHWYDVTAELAGESPPMTIAVEEGLGALQFSPVRFPVTEQPAVVVEKLRSMLKEFAKGHQLGQPQNVTTADTPRALLAANFIWEGDFLRVWYVVDQGWLAFLTYTCEKGTAFAEELGEVEEIVRTLRFER